MKRPILMGSYTGKPYLHVEDKKYIQLFSGLGNKEGLIIEFYFNEGAMSITEFILSTKTLPSLENTLCIQYFKKALMESING